MSEELEDKQIINEAINNRKRITAILFDGTKLPDSDSDRKLLLENIKGLESIALSRTKNRSNEKQAGGLANAQSLIAKAIMEKNKVLPNSIPSKDFTLPDSIERPTLVPGEGDINPEPIDPESIINP